MSALPQSFRAKKARILADLGQSDETYTDKSPKGSVDADIIPFINHLNALDGYVTTSSCAGRIAVFVEGHKSSTGSGPGGKGHGNRWLYVSHSPVDLAQITDLHSFLGLERAAESATSVGSAVLDCETRLVRLSFSPLILHVCCATLRHAKPMLAAAINAGFRESGVQSLKALDDEEAGVMLGVRTAGIAFEAVVGFVVDTHGAERYVSVLTEEGLGLCLRAANGRFRYNSERRERLAEEIGKMDIVARCREDEKVRRDRKREEGLRRQNREQRNRSCSERDDILDEGLALDFA